MNLVVGQLAVGRPTFCFTSLKWKCGSMVSYCTVDTREWFNYGAGEDGC